MKKTDIKKSSLKNKNNKWMIITLVMVILVPVAIIIFVDFKNHGTEPIKTVNKNLSDVSAVNIEKVNTEPDENLPVKKSPVSLDQAKTVAELDFSAWNNSCDPILVVINKDNPISADYKLDIIDYKNVKINSIVQEDLNNMISAAQKIGLNIYPSSGYRSVERQTRLFNNKVLRCKKQGYTNTTEAEIKAATEVARPWTSEHHSGLAIDFNGVKDDFYTTKEYAWLIKNASDYGFILRYPKNKINITGVIFEPWHFRYVGKSVAKEISESGLCLEEYVKSKCIPN